MQNIEENPVLTMQRTHAPGVFLNVDKHSLEGFGNIRRIQYVSQRRAAKTNNLEETHKSGINNLEEMHTL